jgi:hypothetical protein
MRFLTSGFKKNFWIFFKYEYILLTYLKILAFGNCRTCSALQRRSVDSVQDFVVKPCFTSCQNNSISFSATSFWGCDKIACAIMTITHLAEVYSLPNLDPGLFRKYGGALSVSRKRQRVVVHDGIWYGMAEQNSSHVEEQMRWWNWKHKSKLIVSYAVRCDTVYTYCSRKRIPTSWTPASGSSAGILRTSHRLQMWI